MPGGSWVIRCADPQGAIFALEGTARPQARSDISSASHRAIRPTRAAGDGPGKAGHAKYQDCYLSHLRHGRFKA